MVTNREDSQLKHNVTRQVGSPVIHTECPFSVFVYPYRNQKPETNDPPRETTESTTRPDTLRTGTQGTTPVFTPCFHPSRPGSPSGNLWVTTRVRGWDYPFPLLSTPLRITLHGSTEISPSPDVVGVQDSSVFKLGGGLV